MLCFHSTFCTKFFGIIRVFTLLCGVFNFNFHPDFDYEHPWVTHFFHFILCFYEKSKEPQKKWPLWIHSWWVISFERLRSFKLKSQKKSLTFYHANLFFLFSAVCSKKNNRAWFYGFVHSNCLSEVPFALPTSHILSTWSIFPVVWFRQNELPTSPGVFPPQISKFGVQCIHRNVFAQTRVRRTSIWTNTVPHILHRWRLSRHFIYNWTLHPHLVFAVFIRWSEPILGTNENKS